jgi:hypothetical protein
MTDEYEREKYDTGKFPVVCAGTPCTLKEPGRRYGDGHHEQAAGV